MISYLIFCTLRRQPNSTLSPYTTLFRSHPRRLGQPGHRLRRLAGTLAAARRGSGHVSARVEPAEIGRASCRERRWMWVEDGRFKRRKGRHAAANGREVGENEWRAQNSRE